MACHSAATYVQESHSACFGNAQCHTSAIFKLLTLADPLPMSALALLRPAYEAFEYADYGRCTVRATSNWRTCSPAARSRLDMATVVARVLERAQCREGVIRVLPNGMANPASHTRTPMKINFTLGP